jgi:putative colanic acid biosysnthesis UDP-glucose lipid carrier transferase
MIKEISLTPRQRLIKRMLDVLLSSMFLIGCAWPMLIIGIAIKLTSPGPAVYKTRRLTPDGKDLILYKFRTMSISDDGPIIAQSIKRDPRVTNLGRILRRTGLDELPSFFNVLIGDMSIVGPRPKHSYEYEYYQDVRTVIVKVKPGITSSARVNGFLSHDLNSIEHLHRLEIEYVQNWSIWLDLKVILRTIMNGLIYANAY